MSSRTITLCGREIPAHPQKVGYLKHRVLQTWAQAQKSLGDLQITSADKATYSLLCLLSPKIPEYVEEYRFLGFASVEAMEAGDYRPEDDNSSTIPEIASAFRVACEVSGLDLIAQLKGLVNPQKVRDIIGDVLDEAMDEMRAQRLINSLSSPSDADGFPPSTSSGTPPRTSTVNTGSPSLV